jgi:hypothetical protein
LADQKGQGAEDTTADSDAVSSAEILTEYDLKIDTQVEKFLELKHKLTFFLITAAVGSLGFTLNFSIANLGNISQRPERVISLLAATLFSLSAVMFALFSLYNEINSYRLHLKYRYLRKTWEQVDTKNQKAWDRANRFGKLFEKVSFVCLGLSVSLQATLFLLFLV